MDQVWGSHHRSCWLSVKYGLGTVKSDSIAARAVMSGAVNLNEIWWLLALQHPHKPTAVCTWVRTCCAPALHTQQNPSLQIATTEVTEQEYNRLWATNVAGLFNLTARLTPLISEGARLPALPHRSVRTVLRAATMLLLQFGPVGFPCACKSGASA